MSCLSCVGLGGGVKLFSLINEDTRASAETVPAFSFLITSLYERSWQINLGQKPIVMGFWWLPLLFSHYFGRNNYLNDFTL